MQNRRHIVLIGPMGSGKSTLGRVLATRLQLPFVDVDADIVAAAGMSIPAIFTAEGEAGFRQRESLALAAALTSAPSVIATGGGAVLCADNRAAIQTAAAVVYLHVSADAQLRRIGGDSNRPLLTTEAPAQRLAALQAQREPLYRQLATCTIDTSTQTPDQLAADVLRHLHSLQESCA